MKKPVVVYESPTRWDFLSIKRYLKRGIPLWVIEPFHAFHHKKGIRYFPPPLPEFVEDLIKKGKIHLLKAEQIDAKEIYPISADRAVSAIKSVFPEYRKEHKKLFSYISDTLESPVAESVFKKSLCDRLAEFYSVNVLLHRVEELLGTDVILFYSDMNVRSYLFFKSLLSKSNQQHFEHPSIRFPKITYVTSFLKCLKEYSISMSRLSAQTLASGLLGSFGTLRKKKKKTYSYGVTILAPNRQLADNQRGPDFIIDNNKIKAEEVVYFPLADLTDDQKRRLTNLPGAVYYPPKAGQCFSHFTKWAKLFLLVLKKNFLRNAGEIDIACNAFFNYFKWLKVLENIKLSHFITHCDFGLGHIGRNIALNQAGVQTWYFTDSMNHGCNYEDRKQAE